MEYLWKYKKSYCYENSKHDPPNIWNAFHECRLSILGLSDVCPRILDSCENSPGTLSVPSIRIPRIDPSSFLWMTTILR